MEQKQVKIIGLNILEKFGILKATELTFDNENRLIPIKGEVGAGKTTFQKAMRLTTQGSNTLEDKSLYGDNVNLQTQLVDGDRQIFVGCKSDDSGSLSYFLYELDDNGKKIKDPIIDGVKATPAAYLKELQTALTWRLPELTSENPTTQRRILLELYKKELEQQGVIFDKSSPKYVDGIIDQIEKAKERRNYLDMKRKEVGGIADDMNKKGIDFDKRKQLVDESEIKSKIAEFEAKITYATTNVKEQKEANLNKLKAEGLELKGRLVEENNQIKGRNRILEGKKKEVAAQNQDIDLKLNQVKDYVNGLPLDDNFDIDNFLHVLEEGVIRPKKILTEPEKELEFNEKGTCTSDPQDFSGNKELFDLLSDYRDTLRRYKDEATRDESEGVDTTEFEGKVEFYKKKLLTLQETNKDAMAVNAFLDWKDQNEFVHSLNKDYFMKLTEISTGVEGLYISPEYEIDADGNLSAKGNDIYLMYDGRYDKKYFNNPKGELRKLSSYSDTQKPVICLLIQKYLLSRKSKVLPYLWIDQVPIDKKTRDLLEKMAQELGLWLFVNWTGDFSVDSLKDGEILIENGEIFFKD